MMTQRKSLYLIGGAVALLAFVLVLLLVTRTPDEQIAEASEDPQKVELTQKKISEITSMTVKNQEGSYTIKPTEPGVESYYVEELGDEIPVNHDAVKYAIQGGVDPVMVKKVGTVEDLEEFGLEEPTATVTLAFDDGTQVVYLLGDSAPSDEDTRYLSLEGSNDVYIVLSDSHFLKGSASFVDLTVVEIPQAEEEEKDQFGEISLWGSKFPQKIVLTPTGTEGFRMTEPVVSECDSGIVNYLATGLKSVLAQEAVMVYPTDSQLQELGLKEPQAAVQYSVNGESFVLYTAQKDETTTYLYKEGLPVVFEIPTEEVDMWTQITRYQLRSKSVASISPADTQSLELVVEDQRMQFSLSRTEDEEKSTESTVYYTYQALTAEGAKVDLDRYSRLLEDISALTLSADTDETPQGEASLRLVYSGFEDSTQHTLELIPKNAQQEFVVKDGEVLGLVKQTDVQSLIKEAQRLMEYSVPEE